MKKETLRKTLSYLLAFISALFLVFSVVLSVSVVFSSRPTVALLFNKSNYAELVHDEIVLSLESLAIPGGLPDDFFAAGIDKDMIKRDVEKALIAAYSGESFECTEFSEVLRMRVEEYARTTGSDPESQSVASAITQLMSHFEKAYRSRVNPVVLRVLAPAFKVLNPWGIIALSLLFVLALALMTVVFRMNKDDAEPYFSGFFGGSALMLSVLPLTVLLSGRIAKLGISDASLRSLVGNTVYAALWSLIAVAVILLLISAVIIIKKASPKR